MVNVNEATGKPGLHFEQVAFSPSALTGWSFPVARLVGQLPGPHLAVMAGVHVNETSSIDAAVRLQRSVDPSSMRGRISIMPILNQPAVRHRSQYVCPIDGRNINFSFPGSADGSFSEALAWSALNEFAFDADVLIDLHGGDLCEHVAHFMIVQETGDEAFDARNLELANCFDAQMIVQLDPWHLTGEARSVTGRALQKRHAVFAEAGRSGLVEEENVRFHLDGVLRVAKLLGIIEQAPPLRERPEIMAEYLWVQTDTTGFCHYLVEPGDAVTEGATLAFVCDVFGERLGDIRSPADGRILWRQTHALVTEGMFVAGVGTKGLSASGSG